MTRVPIACTLAPEERGERAEEFRRLFASRLRGIAREPRRLRLILDPGEPGEAELHDLLARELACCPFFELHVRPGDPVIVEVAVPAHAEPVLEELALLAEATAR